MEKNKKETNFNPISNKIVNISGATATVALIALILYAVKIIPNEVNIAILFFVSLPIAYSFIFGIILNKPNFSTIRHYGFLFYLITTLIIYMVVLKPDSILEGVRYIFYFILGFILAITGYFFYAISYKIVSKRTDQYRWRALISFGISFIITFLIAFILNHYKIFSLI